MFAKEVKSVVAEKSKGMWQDVVEELRREAQVARDDYDVSARIARDPKSDPVEAAVAVAIAEAELRTAAFLEGVADSLGCEGSPTDDEGPDDFDDDSLD